MKIKEKKIIKMMNMKNKNKMDYYFKKNKNIFCVEK